MNIKKDLTERNFTKGRKGGTIEGIIIHDTGNKSDSAKNNAIYFKKVYRGASAHYFVDDREIIQVVEDVNTAWHCGASNYSNLKNHNTIGIEMCRIDNKVTQATLNNTIKLVKCLIEKYNINVSNVQRHKDVAPTNCPQALNSSDWVYFTSQLNNKKEVYNIKKYKNGSTKEIVYTTSKCNKVIGELFPHEECECIGEILGRAIVRYKISDDEYKVGFVKWLGGIIND